MHPSWPPSLLQLEFTVAQFSAALLSVSPFYVCFSFFFFFQFCWDIIDIWYCLFTVYSIMIWLYMYHEMIPTIILVNMCTCVLSWFSSVRLFCNPMDCGPPDSSVHGILQAGILEWLPCPPPEDLPDPGIEPMSPELQLDSLQYKTKSSKKIFKLKIKTYLVDWSQ